MVESSSSHTDSKGSSHDFSNEDLTGSVSEVKEVKSERSSKSAPTPDSVFNGWSNSKSETGTVTDLNSLRSNVKVTQKVSFNSFVFYYWSKTGNVLISELTNSLFYVINLLIKYLISCCVMLCIV